MATTLLECLLAPSPCQAVLVSGLAAVDSLSILCHNDVAEKCCLRELLLLFLCITLFACVIRWRPVAPAAPGCMQVCFPCCHFSPPATSLLSLPCCHFRQCVIAQRQLALSC